MSKFVRINTELREAEVVVRALADLEIPYEEKARYRHVYSGREEVVPIVVRKRGAYFGLRQPETGPLEVIGDDMQMGEIQKTLEKVQQRYAYHMVLRETQKAGFDLVEEATGKDNVIRMTVRRWQ